MVEEKIVLSDAVSSSAAVTNQFKSADHNRSVTLSSRDEVLIRRTEIDFAFPVSAHQRTRLRTGTGKHSRSALDSAFKSCPALFADSSSADHVARVNYYGTQPVNRKLADRRSSRSCCYLPLIMPGSRLANYDATDVMIKLNGNTLKEDGAGRDGDSQSGEEEGPEVPSRHAKKTLTRYRSMSMPVFDVDMLPTVSNSSSQNSVGVPGDQTGDQSPTWKTSAGMLDLHSTTLMKSVSTPEIATSSADQRSLLPEELDLAYFDSDGEGVSTPDAVSMKTVPATPPTHVMIRELLMKYQGHHLLGKRSDGREESVTGSPISGQRISLSEALHDLPDASRPPGHDSRDQYALSTASLPRLSTSSSLLLRKKTDKDKTKKLIRRSSHIFSLGGRSKRNKEEIRRCQQTHSFVSVSFSNAAPCQVCGKPLAHKSAVQCQNCYFACHENSGCFDHTEACRGTASGTAATIGLRCLPMTVHHERTGSGGSSVVSSVPLTVTGSGGPPIVPSVLIDSTKLDKVMMDVHGYAANNVRQQDVTMLGLFPLENVPAPSVKRLSVPSSFESQAATMASAHSESSLSPSSPSSRRPISPGSFSRWKSVADKLLNKPGSTDSHADYDSPAEDNSSADNPPDGRDLLSHARLLEFDPDLRLATLEMDSWQAMQDKEYLSTLPSNEVHRQNNIYELIRTEKEYCTKLLIIDQVYVRGLRSKLGWNDDKIQQVFPFLSEIVRLHTGFLSRLRAVQQKEPSVAMIGDVIVDQFSGQRGEEMKIAYAEFCSRHKSMLKKTKEKLEQDKGFKDFHKERIEQLKCRSGTFDIPSCYSFITQRIFKYELLVKELIKRTQESNPDNAVLIRALEFIKIFFNHVSHAMAVEDRRELLSNIYKAVDAAAVATVDGETWRKHSFMGEERTLIHEGIVTVLNRPPGIQNNAKKPPKEITLRLLLFSDSLVFLLEKNQKLTFAQFEEKKPPIIPLKNVVCVRSMPEKGNKKGTGFFVIASTRGGADTVMYEVICVNDHKDCEKWQSEIVMAKANMPIDGKALTGLNNVPDHSAIDEAQLQRIRDTIAACEEKDNRISQLIQEKFGLIEKMIDYAGISRDRMHLPPLLTISEENMGSEQIQCIIKAALVEVDKLASLPCALSPLNQDASDPVSLASSGTGPELTRLPTTETSPGPRRHGTFNGFDGSKEAEALRNASRSTSMKDQSRSRRPPHHSTTKSNLLSEKTSSSLGVSSLISSSRDSCGDYSSSSAISSSPGSSPRASTFLTDDNSAMLPSVLQLQWYLNQLADAVSRQTTAFETLNSRYTEGQQRLAALEAREKLNRGFSTSAQLEELRNKEEAFRKEKHQYLLERDAEMQEQKTKRQEFDKDAAKLKSDMEDIEKQRNAMFVQCEKLRESGMEVKLSTTAPYVQIFHCQPTMPTSPPPTLPPQMTMHFEDRKPPHHIPVHSNLAAPGSYIPFSTPNCSIDPRSRPLIATSQSLNPIRIPVAPPMPAVIPPSHVPARPPIAELPPVPSKHHSFSISNWRGSMESLVQKTGANAKDKMRSLYDSQDKTDAVPRPNLRTTSEAKLGISNLMHLSEKTSVVIGKENGQISPADSKKKSSDKKRTFL